MATTDLLSTRKMEEVVVGEFLPFSTNFMYFPLQRDNLAHSGPATSPCVQETEGGKIREREWTEDPIPVYAK